MQVHQQHREAMVTLQPELPEPILHSILRKCEFKDICHAACVDRRWRLAASDDSIWKDLCQKDYCISTATDPLRNPCSSFKESYKSWHTSFSKYPQPLVLRTKQCWHSLRSWTSCNYPEAADSLIDGVSEEELEEFEAKLGWKLPPAVRLIYRFCGGQRTSDNLVDSDDSDTEREAHASLGLIGGYQFYDHMVTVHLLSLPNVLLLTKLIIHSFGNLEDMQKWIIVATSFSSRKLFFLDCSDGSLYVGTHKATNGELMPCVPRCSVNSNYQDSMLRWLEEYAARLQSGIYTVQNFDGTKMISLYPDKGPLCSEEVTNGVQVRSSAVLVPELSTTSEHGSSESYLFSYFIRMRLLPKAFGSNSLNSCQLLRRHWVILENGVVKDEVNGAAVIGKYPLLEAGGKTFSYASCSSFSGPAGSIYGDFTFVPGSLRHPTGPEFLVKVAEFPFQVPEFIY